MYMFPRPNRGGLSIQSRGSLSVARYIISQCEMHIYSAPPLTQQKSRYSTTPFSTRKLPLRWQRLCYKRYAIEMAKTPMQERVYKDL